MLEIGRLEEMGNVSVLKPEGLEEAHQDFMSFGPFRGHILKGDLAEDHIGSNHPFSVIVIRGKAGDFQESENLPVIFEESLRQTFPVGIRERITGQVKKPLFEEMHSSVEDPRGEFPPFPIQSMGFGQDSPKLPSSHLVFRRRVPDVFDFAVEVDQTPLPPSPCPVVGRKEVTHRDALEIGGENLFGDLPSPAPSNPVESQSPIHKDPKPMKHTRYLPSGLIPVNPGRLPNCLQDDFFLDFKPFGKALERLGESRIRDFEPAKLLEENPDLGIRKAVMVFEKNRLNEDIGTQIPIRDLFQGIRSGLFLPAIRAPITVAEESSRFDLCRDNIFLDMLLKLRGKLGQGVLAAIRTVRESLMNRMVDEFGFVPGDAGVSYGPSQFLPTPLEFPLEGRDFQGFGPLLLFQSLHFLLKLLDLLPETEDLFDQLFFGFLYEEEGVACQAVCLNHSDFRFGRNGENLKGLLRTR